MVITPIFSHLNGIQRPRIIHCFYLWCRSLFTVFLGPTQRKWSFCAHDVCTRPLAAMINSTKSAVIMTESCDHIYFCLKIERNCGEYKDWISNAMSMEWKERVWCGETKKKLLGMFSSTNIWGVTPLTQCCQFHKTMGVSCWTLARLTVILKIVLTTMTTLGKELLHLNIEQTIFR